MERQPKEKKSLQNEGDPDTVDSLVVALASEILAPENLNFLLPITAFTVPFPNLHRVNFRLLWYSCQVNGPRY